MSMFSQSLCIGENTLQELEKGAGLQPVKVGTPNRSSTAMNSDTDIIEESPTNHSIFSRRERCKIKNNKSKASAKMKRVKSRSSDQLTTTETSTEEKAGSSKNTLSQFFRSEYDFGDEILEILPGNASDTKTRNCDNKNIEEKSLENVKIIENVLCFESDMFSEWVVPVCPSKPSIEIQANDQKDDPLKIAWEDSYDFNDVDLDCCEEIKEDNVKELNLNVDEQIALGIDNVTFTQNFMNEASFENDLNVNGGSTSFAASKFIQEEMEICKNSFTEVMRDELKPSSHNYSRSAAQMSSFNIFNKSESSFTLNYSGSSVDFGVDDEKHLMSPNVEKESNSQRLNHLNSIDSWGE